MAQINRLKRCWTLINYVVVECKHQSETGSIVLIVKDKERKSYYALKLIGPLDDSLKNLIFKREANALKILNRYDDIVTIYDSAIGMKYDTRKNLGGLLLENVEGETLDQIDLTAFSNLKKQDLCLKILRAIANAHNNNIIHRDIKPDNIMYLKDKVKVIDFGSSKIKSIVEKETTLPMFSPKYSAPEVVAGGETTEASDIYSLGAVFFEILLGQEPPSSNEKMICSIENSNLNKDIKVLLNEMLNPDIDDRLNNISHAITVFEKRIGDLNANTNKFCFLIDPFKLNDLKKAYVVEESMTITQFVAGFLPHDFKELYGMVDSEAKIYKFVGNQLYMECLFDSQTNLFQVTKIYEIPVDRKVRLQKLYLPVDGTIKFYRQKTADLPLHNNRKLKVILANHSNEIQSLQNKSARFDRLFGKWKQSLFDSISSKKKQNGKIRYKKFSIEGNVLVLTVEEYENNSIDYVDSNMRYIFETVEQGRIRTYIIGNFEDAIVSNSEIELRIKIDPKAPKSKLIQFLDAKNDVLEDYNYKIMSFKRQINAISSLYNDECSARSLKDIILELETPTSTSAIKSIKFMSKELDDSQKKAVDIALHSDSISLIQGPPGTGKTKVIHEILNQIVSRPENFSEISKILVVSQSHAAVDNILEGLNITERNDIRVLRIGDKKNISREIAEKYMLESIRENLFTSVKKKSEQFVAAKLELCKPQDTSSDGDNNSEYAKWLKIKEIQEDWVRRCGDYESLDYQLINSASIIAGTCTGFLSNEFVRDMEFDYVIVDEAAKATTPELLVSIIKAQKIVLVGDQKQLPPFIDNSLSELLPELAKNPEYRLFDILFGILPDTHKQLLTTQYRMIGNIGNLISKVFYDGQISTGIDDEKRQHDIPLYGKNSIIWYNTSSLKEQSENRMSNGGSYMNITENKIINDILGRLNQLKQARSLDIGIITGYRAQKDLIKKSVSNSNYENIGKIDINTLDAFQGRENDIIIYSTVRTRRSIGFQKEKERINVAFSRAKKLLIVVGDLDFFYGWDNDENKYVEVINYIRENPEFCQIINSSEGDLIE